MNKNKEFGFTMNVEDTEDNIGICYVYMSKVLKLPKSFDQDVEVSMSINKDYSLPLTLKINCIDWTEGKHTAKRLERLLDDLINYLQLNKQRFFYTANFNYHR